MDEIHSILGTDELNLSPELEAHYQKFFKRRADIVNLSLGVNKVFEDVRAEINNYKQSLDLLASQIDGDYSGYNAMVGPINNIVASAQGLDTKQQQLIDDYNSKIAEFNKLIEKYNLLDKSLDSKAAEKVES